MKRIPLLLSFLFMFHTNFSQHLIDQPKFGFSSLPGEITKVELLDTTTVLHFIVNYRPGNWISIPKETFIQDIRSDEKLFVTKAEGIPLMEKYWMPESGTVNSYKLFFPMLDKTSASKIDFGEANERGNWYVYDIELGKQEYTSMIPEELIGDWLQTDGCNTCDLWNICTKCDHG